MAHAGINRIEIAKRRERVSELYCRGKRQTAIAEELGIAQSTVSKDLKAIQAKWLESALRDFDAARGEELAKIDALEREYWLAWERSKENSERTLKEHRTADNQASGSVTDRAQVIRERNTGEARYLEGVMSCIEKRCKLLGLNAPEKFAPTDPTGQQEWKGDLTRLSDDELLSLKSILELVSAPAAGGGPQGA